MEDEDAYCYGRPARVTQGDSPVWEPLIEAVGERLVGTFMWMYEEEMADGTILHVYKHIHTRRYMHLATDGRAFAYTPCGLRLRMELSHAIEEALCSWWILSGWDEEDAAAVRDAVYRASEWATQEHIKKAHVGLSGLSPLRSMHGRRLHPRSQDALLAPGRARRGG